MMYYKSPILLLSFFSSFVYVSNSHAMETAPLSETQLDIISLIDNYTRTPHRLSTKTYHSLQDKIREAFENPQQKNLFHTIDQVIINKSILTLSEPNDNQNDNQEECTSALRILANFCENEQKKYLVTSQQFAQEQVKASTPKALFQLKDNQRFFSLVYSEQFILSELNKLYISPIDQEYSWAKQEINSYYHNTSNISKDISPERLKIWDTAITRFYTHPFNSNPLNRTQIADEQHVRFQLEEITRYLIFSIECSLIETTYNNILSARKDFTQLSVTNKKLQLDYILRYINQERINNWQNNVDVFFSTYEDYDKEQTVREQLHYLAVQVKTIPGELKQLESPSDYYPSSSSSSSPVDDSFISPPLPRKKSSPRLLPKSVGKGLKKLSVKG